jgi:hypothetical protein
LHIYIFNSQKKRKEKKRKVGSTLWILIESSAEKKKKKRYEQVVRMMNYILKKRTTETLKMITRFLMAGAYWILFWGGRRTFIMCVRVCVCIAKLEKMRRDDERWWCSNKLPKWQTSSIQQHIQPNASHIKFIALTLRAITASL